MSEDKDIFDMPKTKEQWEAVVANQQEEKKQQLTEKQQKINAIQSEQDWEDLHYSASFIKWKYGRIKLTPDRIVGKG